MCRLNRSILRLFWDAAYEAGRADALREEFETAAAYPENVVDFESFRRERTVHYGRRRDDVVGTERDA